MIKITKSPHNLIFTDSGVQTTLRKLGQLIREGSEIEVQCTSECDWTKETLIKIAFEDTLPTTWKEGVINILVEFVSTAQLYRIIENGGYESYRKRQNRGLLFDGEYCFDRLGELCTEFARSGGNPQEFRHCFTNYMKEIE